MKANIIILRKTLPLPELDDLIYLARQEKKRCFVGSQDIVNAEI
jgi:hypothetical protein